MNVCVCVCVRVVRLTDSWGHTETGPRFKDSSESLEKPGIEPATPGLWYNECVHDVRLDWPDFILKD